MGQHLQPLLRGLFKSPSSTGADPPHAPEDCLRDFLHSLDPSERRALALGLLELFDAQDDVRLVYKLRCVPRVSGLVFMKLLFFPLHSSHFVRLFRCVLLPLGGGCRRVLAEVLQTEDPEDKAEAGLTAVV